MGKQALILTSGKALVDWSLDHDYTQDGPEIYRPSDHTIITDDFDPLPSDWKEFVWVWNSDLLQFDNMRMDLCSTAKTPHPSENMIGCGDIDIEAVSANTTGFGNAMHLHSDGSWIDAKGDASSTMPCMAIALESGVGKKKLLKDGYVRNDSWDLSVGDWVYVSYTNAGEFTQSKATTGQRQQKVGYAYRSNIIRFGPSSEEKLV